MGMEVVGAVLGKDLRLRRVEIERGETYRRRSWFLRKAQKSRSAEWCW